MQNVTVISLGTLFLWDTGEYILAEYHGLTVVYKVTSRSEIYFKEKNLADDVIRLFVKWSTDVRTAIVDITCNYIVGIKYNFFQKQQHKLAYF